MSETILKQGKILIVDDEKANVRFLEIILQKAGYTNVYSTTDSCQAHPRLDVWRRYWNEERLHSRAPYGQGAMCHPMSLQQNGLNQLT